MSITIVHTPLATVHLTGPHRIELRLQPGLRVDVTGLRAIRDARKFLADGTPADVLAFVPEDLDFDLAIVLTNHYADEDPAPYTRSMAIVTSSGLYAQLVRIYCTHHRTTYPVRVFPCPLQADAWICQAEPEGE